MNPNGNPDDEERAEIARKANLMEAVARQETECGRLFAEADAASEAAKAARKQAESAVARLRQMIRELNEPLLPFPEVDDDAWRSTPLRELDGLGAKDLEKLEKSELETLGDLADWGSPPNPRALTDIPGIGPTRATAIETALERYWGERLERAGMASDLDDEGE